MIKILVYGYGNLGRQDDGLGIELVSRLEQAQIPGVDFDSNYQLNIEDAENIAPYDAVIFVDASMDAEPPFTFSKISPAMEITFTTHAMAPDSVVALCHDMYGKYPPSYVLAIPGYEWEMMKEGLTEKAVQNLEKAVSFMQAQLKDATLEGLEVAAGVKPVS
ncbi:MAG: hydrogenase maturation protease [bacterium]|nr:hydrogenase maturation protease [bacterium]